MCGLNFAIFYICHGFKIMIVLKQLVHDGDSVLAVVVKAETERQLALGDLDCENFKTR